MYSKLLNLSFCKASAVGPLAGLTSVHLQKLRDEFGYNEIKSKKKPKILKFLSHFWGLTAWLLEVLINNNYLYLFFYINMFFPSFSLLIFNMLNTDIFHFLIIFVIISSCLT